VLIHFFEKSEEETLEVKNFKNSKQYSLKFEYLFERVENDKKSF